MSGIQSCKFQKRLSWIVSILLKERRNFTRLLPPEKVKKCLSRMRWKLSRTVLRRGKGSNPFSLVEYASHDFQKLLKRHGFIPSMSGKGNCYDNAPAGSFFSTIKSELIFLNQFKTRSQARQAIFEYIEVFYNRWGRHASLDYLTPVEFKSQYFLDKAA